MGIGKLHSTETANVHQQLSTNTTTDAHRWLSTNKIADVHQQLSTNTQVDGQTNRASMELCRLAEFLAKSICKLRAEFLLLFCLHFSLELWQWLLCGLSSLALLGHWQQ